MTHTGRMSTPIRPGTARRLGLRAPTLRPGGLLVFPKHLTGEQRTEIERAWLRHRGEWPRPVNRAELVEVFSDPEKVRQITVNDPTTKAFVQAYTSRLLPLPAPRRRWWQRRDR